MTTNGRLRVLILGAGSGIAQATARLYAGESAIIGLAGRNTGRLAEVANDLRVRGATRVETFDVDFTVAAAPPTLAAIADELGGIDHVLLAYGVYGEHSLAERDPGLALSIIDGNLRSAAAWTLAVAGLLE